MVDSVELKLHCSRDGGCGDAKKAITGYQLGLRQESTWGHESMGHVSRRRFEEELAASACFVCCLLRMLLQMLLFQESTHALQNDVPSVSPARGSIGSNGQEVWSTPLSGEAWPIRSVRRVFVQQNAAVEYKSTHTWLYHDVLTEYDEWTHNQSNCLRLRD